MAKNLLHNVHIFISPYLHQLLPALLSCVLAKSLHESGAIAEVKQLHWDIRTEAAEVVAFVCQKFGPVYSDVQVCLYPHPILFVCFLFFFFFFTVQVLFIPEKRFSIH